MTCPIRVDRMLLLCHILAVTILQILIISENWVFAKNINFYNPHHSQTVSSVLLAKMQGIIITAIDGQKTSGVRRTHSIV